MIRLATALQPYSANLSGSVLPRIQPNLILRATGYGAHAPRPSPEPSPEPYPEPNPEPDTALNDIYSSMNPAHWDVLFKAVTTRLTACACDAGRALNGEHPLGVVASLEQINVECAAALTLLHAELQRERQQRQAFPN